VQFIAESAADGITERLFTVGDVPGVLWTATGTLRSSALVLMAHGGGQHKQHPGPAARARRYVAAGFAVAAIDAPGHGDRPRTERDERFAEGMRQRRASGGALGPHIAAYSTELSASAVPEWRATLDRLQDLDDIGPDAPVGFWGVSLGSATGVPLVAEEPRITAAVLGLAGLEFVGGAAPRVAVPVEFLLQWDDELVPRDSGLAVFDAFASREKTLHANPGGHIAVPAFEVESSVRFFERHLL
jgi:pimeloyl-ACP methyl ester carboxylesterase